jgi:hypothetical protein
MDGGPNGTDEEEDYILSEKETREMWKEIFEEIFSSAGINEALIEIHGGKPGNN